MGIFGKVKKGIIFIVSAPAGTGKTTLVQMLIDEFPHEMQRSISCTTRPPRGNEQDGVDYIFLTQDEFNRKIEEEAFLEYARVFDHYYGTLKATIFSLQLTGKHVFLIIDTQGALYLKDKLEAVFIFIVPPSLAVLRGRLEKRHTESKAVIDLRLSHAQTELAQAQYYDYIVMNDQLEKGYRDFKEFVGQAERKLCQYIH
jgi:guanylate kinase